MNNMQLTPNSYDGLLAAKTAKGLEYIPFQEIIFIKADHKYAYIYLRDKIQPVKVFVSISILYQSLPKDHFYRCHRSYILNMHYRRILIKDRTIALTDNHIVPISEECFNEFLRRTSGLG